MEIRLKRVARLQALSFLGDRMFSKERMSGLFRVGLARGEPKDPGFVPIKNFGRVSVGIIRSSAL
jgi:hypothetical protein